ncbi:MAG TPA: condensation domain-containing protein, partial [Verrucomicrobiae bacterium]|nr:condensation domain-containing protein [Verrucomicrobiae bacterium]
MLLRLLPEYMVPADLVAVRELPLTPNGKTDRKFLAERENVQRKSKANFQHPRTLMEQALAGIWAELLGVERVGLTDNFFELGGDSIITIQVVSRARRMGYILKPRDLFAYQTIGKLSAALVERTRVAGLGEQGVLTGGSGLTPIQRWYLDSAVEEVSHYNQSVLLGIDKGLDADRLEAAVEALLRQHDALRFVYRRGASGWEQSYGTYKGRLDREDLRGVEDYGAEMTRLSDGYQRSLAISKGELIRVVWFQTPAFERDNRLLIIIHHLVVDGVSWRILLEDLEELLEGGVKPGRKSSSYREWQEQLVHYGRRTLGQLKYWTAVLAGYRPLVADNGLVRMADMGSCVVRLDKEQTRRLLQEVPRAYHTEINDVLLAALAKTICGWQGRDRITIGLEGHGREEGLFDGVDVSRTVGWFTSLYPVLLEVGQGIDGLLKGVKEQLRAVPDKGLGYGVLRYLKGALEDKDSWDITFNYLGQLDNIVRRSKWFRGVGGSAGTGIGEKHVVREKLLINGAVRGGELVLNWRYSRL